MVKIKDFTLASQNRGGGHVPPRALHTGRPWFPAGVFAEK